MELMKSIKSMKLGLSEIISFTLGLILAIVLLRSINYRNCIVLSSSVSKELLDSKVYSAENDKCYRVVKKE